jgi:hypothetical protein
VPSAGPYSAGSAERVTAHAGRGYVFAATPHGWTRRSSTVETYPVNFGAAPRCVTPERPMITPAHCGSHPSAPGLLLLGSDGVDYSTSTDAPYSPGQNVTITADAAAGYRFGNPAVSGWHTVNATTETYPVHFASC